MALHPDGMAPRINNFSEWSVRIRRRIRRLIARDPNPQLDALVMELDAYAAADAQPLGPDLDDLGYAVPLHLRTPHGDMRLITAITTFSTATDVTLAELQLETFLPADDSTRRTPQRAAVRDRGAPGWYRAITGPRRHLVIGRKR